MSDNYESIFTGDQVDEAIRKASLLNDQTLIVTDNTDNNVSTDKHGFIPKLPGSGSLVFTGDGTYKTLEEIGVSVSWENISNIPVAVSSLSSGSIGSEYLGITTICGGSF